MKKAYISQKEKTRKLADIGITLSLLISAITILLLPQIRCREDASEIAHRLIEVLQPEFVLEHYCLTVTASIGVAVYPDDALDASTLIQNADAALYQAKKCGRNNYQYYSADAIASSRAFNQSP